MSVAETTTIVETERHAMQRLLAKARAEGVKLGRDAEGRYWAASTSIPGVWYALTAISCTCKGFAGHQRCKHLAALHAHLGWLTEDVDPEPEPTKAPIVGLVHTEGAWIDDDLTPAGMLRYRQARTSLYRDGIELIRVTGEDQVSAVCMPGTERAIDVETHGSHFDTVVAWIRSLAPEANFEQLLAAAELFHPAEFVEETDLVAA